LLADSSEFVAEFLERFDIEFADLAGEGSGAKKQYNQNEVNSPHGGELADWRVELKYVSAGLPKPTGWQPVLPRDHVFA
jgi:hypothetical protein